MSVRPPAVAGAFYSGTRAGLEQQVADCFAENPPVTTKEPVLGAVVPHAGLMYSGHVAAAVYAAADLPARLIILCPNHTGAGEPAAVSPDAAWRTPLGEAEVDEELAAELGRETGVLVRDPRAHAREHSLEVQLPFLQATLGEFRFVPICLATYRYETCEEVAAAIARVVAAHRDRGERIAIVASSDLNHYEDQKTTLVKDQKAIDRILALDAEGLWNTVRREDISMCGFVPTTVMLLAAKQLGATSARLLKHATSGDINGDYSGVVGYAGILVA